jgi:tripartite-type tricarboxylate transporter receptor subunit TctC
MVSRRVALAACVVGAASLSGWGAQAQDYPTKPITLIVPWTAGGSTDITMRAMAEVASKHLGQPIVIDNKAGGGGTVGPATMAATAKPDGYTLSQIPVTVFRLPLMQKTSWDAQKDFSYIIHLTGYTFGIIAKGDGPFKTFGDMIAFAKANPGKVSYGTPGAGTSLHIGMETIAARQGVKFTHVPFKGNAETNAAVLGGHTMVAADSSGWKPLVQAGQLRLLAVWTADRLKDFPDVPTLRDLGMPYVFDSPFGIAGPKGMDPKIVAKIHDAFKKALDDPGVQATLTKYDMVVNYKNSADYAKAIDENIAAEKQIIDQLGLARTSN